MAESRRRRSPGLPGTGGFEKHCAFPRADAARGIAGPGSGRGRRSPRHRGGLRGKATGTDGASRSRYLSVGQARESGGSPRSLRPWPRRPWRRTRRAGGTVRPNTGARPAGGGPPMAGHGCQSVGGKVTGGCLRKARRTSPVGRTQPHGHVGLPSGGLMFLKTGFLKSGGREPGESG